MGRRHSKRRIPEGKEGCTPATGSWEAAIKRVRCDACGAPVSNKAQFYDNYRWTEACAGPPDTAAPVAAGGDGALAAPCRQLYTDADATLMEAALDLCELKLKHNIKMAAFERLSMLPKKHMLPKDGYDLTETWYRVEPCLNNPDIKKYIVHCSCQCDEHRYGHSLDGD
eukprot:jgi/Tetstr1/443855/TSEL_031809.t1